MVDPTILEFKPSSDHNTITNGVPLVSGYQFEMYRPGASAPFQTTPLGKPAVNPQGFVRLSLGALLVPLPSAGIEYTAKVSAVGPGGRGRSSASNKFMWAAPPPPCSYTVTPAAAVGSGGGMFTATVTAPAGCSWTATENLSWVSITAGASRSGNGTVTYSVTANSGTSARPRVGDDRRDHLQRHADRKVLHYVDLGVVAVDAARRRHRDGDGGGACRLLVDRHGEPELGVHHWRQRDWQRHGDLLE